MSKTQDKAKRVITILCLGAMSFGYYSNAWTFNNLFDDIIKTTEKSKPIDKIFDGKLGTENLYKKSLEYIQHETAISVKDNVEEVSKRLSEESKESINPQDILNILADAGIERKKITSIIYTIKKKIGLTAEEEDISASYRRLSKKIAVCVDKANIEERICIQKRVTQQYQFSESNNTDINSFKEQNYGEDLYTNGTIDDSDYDILVDIQNISKILFTSFISPTETLFYKLPQKKSSYINNTFNGILNSVNTNGGNRNLPNNQNGGIINSDNNETTDLIENNGRTINTTNIEDKNIDSFIGKTNTTYKTTTTTVTKKNTVNPLGIVKGNLCIQAISGLNSETTTTITTVEPTTTTIQSYLDELDTKIINSTPPINYVPIDILSGGSNNPSPEEITKTNQLIEAKINNIFDEQQTKSCTVQCENKDNQKRANCETEYTKNKIICKDMNYIDKTICLKNALDTKSTCTDPLIAENIICKIECLCFSTQYPKAGKGLEGMEGQLKVRFCSIPVQQNRINKGRNILGLEDSLNRIKSILENLVNGGEMIKYARPKEYLDSPLSAIKWAEFLSFDIKTYIKTVFPVVSSEQKKKDKEKITKTTEESAKGKDGDEKTKNINSIIQQDKDRAIITAGKTAIGGSYEEIRRKIEEEEIKIKGEQRNLNPKNVVINSKNEKAIMFNEQIGVFLEKNYGILFEMEKELTIFKELSNKLFQKTVSSQ